MTIFLQKSHRSQWMARERLRRRRPLHRSSYYNLPQVQLPLIMWPKLHAKVMWWQTKPSPWQLSNSYVGHWVNGWWSFYAKLLFPISENNLPDPHRLWDTVKLMLKTMNCVVLSWRIRKQTHFDISHAVHHVTLCCLKLTVKYNHVLFAVFCPNVIVFFIRWVI